MQFQAAKTNIIALILIFLRISSATLKGPRGATIGENGVEIQTAICRGIWYPKSLIYKTVRRGTSWVNMLMEDNQRSLAFIEHTPGPDEELPIEGPYYKVSIEGLIPTARHHLCKDFVIFTMQGKLVNVITRYRSDITEKRPRRYWIEQDCFLRYNVAPATEES